MSVTATNPYYNRQTSNVHFATTDEEDSNQNKKMNGVLSSSSESRSSAEADKGLILQSSRKRRRQKGQEEVQGKQHFAVGAEDEDPKAEDTHARVQGARQKDKVETETHVIRPQQRQAEL